LQVDLQLPMQSVPSPLMLWDVKKFVSDLQQVGHTNEIILNKFTKQLCSVLPIIIEELLNIFMSHWQCIKITDIQSMFKTHIWSMEQVWIVPLCQTFFWIYNPNFCRWIYNYLCNRCHHPSTKFYSASPLYKYLYLHPK
jgi:hypothetical protein